MKNREQKTENREQRTQRESRSAFYVPRFVPRGFTPTPTLSPFRFFKKVSVAVQGRGCGLSVAEHTSETKKLQQNWCRGFTLVEMIVAVGLFTIVLFIASSAFLSVVNADRKTRAVRIATDNLNLALEDMSRQIKTGTTYNCGGTVGGTVADCATAQSIFTFTAQDGSYVTYKRGIGAADCGAGFSGVKGCIVRSDSSGSIPVTSPEIDIITLNFLASDTAVGAPNNAQPSVLVFVSGSLQSGSAAPATTFNIQTLITQRAYDA